MRALVLTADGPVLRSDHVEPVADGEALIGMRLGGVCATDLELVKGYMGFEGVLGHEWVGTVLESPDPAWVGRRVVGDINAACGACATCLAGRPTHCPHRTVLGIQGRDGAFSDRFRLPVRNLHAVPDEVADEAAVFVEPLAAALRILGQVHVRRQRHRPHVRRRVPVAVAPHRRARMPGEVVVPDAGQPQRVR